MNSKVQNCFVSLHSATLHRTLKDSPCLIKIEINYYNVFSTGQEDNKSGSLIIILIIIIKINNFLQKFSKFEILFFCLVLEIFTHKMTSLCLDINTLISPWLQEYEVIRIIQVNQESR